MPELPEVETIKNDLAKLIVGLKIVGVEVFDNRVLANLKENQFIKALEQTTIHQIYRRGKTLIIHLDQNKFLVVHLKMTGQLIYGKHLKEEGLKETKIVFKLSNNFYLNYNDQRLFGRLWVVDDLSKISLLEKLGPEPFDKDFNIEFLNSKLKNRLVPIKVLLLNQEFLAGIGNIYASEILFDAGIKPQKKAYKLTKDQIKKLHQSTLKILSQAINLRGSSMRNYRDSSGEKGKFKDCIKVYARENQDCPQCSTKIIKIVQASRSTFYCKNCQN